MSNLSDLLPAGAGAKVITATASGNLATGQTVILQSDGTVTAIAAVAEGLGSEVVFETAQSYYIQPIFDSSNNKVVIIYTDSGDSNHGKAIVGTVSGTSISFGTAVPFNAATTYFQSGTFDSNSNKVVIVFRDQGDSEKTKAVVGTVSGTSISFGSEATISTNTLGESSTTFDSNLNKVVTFYKDTANSSYGTAAVGTVSGTSITFGTPVVFESAGSGMVQQASCFDTSSNKTVLVYTDEGDGNQGTAIVGTVSGTSISFGTPVVFHAAGTANSVCAFDTTNNKVVIAYEDTADSEKGKSLVGTVSGTSISYGSEVEFEGGGIQEVGMTFDPDAGKAVVVYMDKGNSNYGTYAVGTVSGTSITYATPVVFAAATSERCTATYDTNSDKIVIGFEDGGNSNYGTSIVLQLASTNSSNFAGITNQAINNSASGEVVVEGGVITNSSLVPDVPAISVGTAGDTSDTGQHMAAAYDANAQRVVTFYRDNNNSNYGTSAVGTVSGTSITFGTPVVFNSASTGNCTAAYNSTAQKVMVAFNSAGSTGKAIYGAVSGTTIDFSSYTVTQFDSNNISEMQVVFDTNAEKMVIAYKLPGSESQLGKAVVGTLSGTTLSFGTAVTFNNAATEKVTAAYDSTNNKVVILYQDSGNSNYPTAIVGTVSGTSISFGSETALSSSAASWNTVSYDSGNQKIVAAYRDDVVEDLKVAVGTVSGTSISFATPVSFDVLVQWLSSAYDPDNGIVLFNFKNQSGNAGTCVPAIIDGTSFSFGSSVVFETGSTEYTSTVYDTNADKFVVAFNDGGGGDQGRAVVQTSSKTVGLTVASTYYVQDDGSLSTTSSSVTAGKAVSTTTLMLKG